MAIDTIHTAHHQALRTACLRSRQFCGHGPDLSTWRPVGEGERGQERGRDTETGDSNRRRGHDRKRDKGTTAPRPAREREATAPTQARGPAETAGGAHS